jgi:hypothetical protein
MYIYMFDVSYFGHKIGSMTDCIDIVYSALSIFMGIWILINK